MQIINYVIDKKFAIKHYNEYQPVYNIKIRAYNGAYRLPKLQPKVTPDINS